MSEVSCRPACAMLPMLAAATGNAAEKKRGPKLPEGARGFSGTVQGKVVSAKETGFVLAVEKVVNTWKNSKAEKPESLVGTKIRVVAGKVEGKPYEKHVRFIKNLKVDETIAIEVKHDKGNALVILELNEEQRKRGGEAK